jgi:hypothetical protein
MKYIILLFEYFIDICIKIFNFSKIFILEPVFNEMTAEEKALSIMEKQGFVIGKGLGKDN